jgi:hypothetical protein
MIYTASYVMFWVRADPLRGQGGEGWALEIKAFLGPVKWHRAIRRVPFGAQKNLWIRIREDKTHWDRTVFVHFRNSAILF